MKLLTKPARRNLHKEVQSSRGRGASVLGGSFAVSPSPLPLLASANGPNIYLLPGSSILPLCLVQLGRGGTVSR